MSDQAGTTATTPEQQIEELRSRRDEKREEARAAAAELHEAERQLSVRTGTRFVAIAKARQLPDGSFESTSAAVYGVRQEHPTRAGVLTLHLAGPNAASVTHTFFGGNCVRLQLGLRSPVACEITEVADADMKEVTLLHVMLWDKLEDAETWAQNMQRRNQCAPGQ